jgi:hypothetical protein
MRHNGKGLPLPSYRQLLLDVIKLFSLDNGDRSVLYLQQTKPMLFHVITVYKHHSMFCSQA